MERIRKKLEEAFTPVRLEVTDDSARHAGHAGSSEAGETHFNVTIISDAFADLSRVQIQRTIHMVLGEEFETGLHALSLKASVPQPDEGEDT
ncbi:MAG: BolA family transcriptional regulator [Hyphomonadaceae bacterium]|nr:BolA family transcriptional regulator [Hyphomonadaceae bacterium]